MSDPRPQPDRREFLAQTGIAVSAAALGTEAPAKETAPFVEITPPAWVLEVTRMAFATPGEAAKAAELGAQVLHTNVVWPYFPLRRDGGGLPKNEAKALRDLVAECRRVKLKLSLGLPPFPPVALVRKHPDWRVHPDDTGAALKVEPKEDDLGTRLGCNNGPWGDYLIDVCAELVADSGVNGFSFDGNYHPPICFCPACKAAYRKDRGRDLPPKANLDDIAYREYLVWRGEQLEGHYRRMQERIKKADPDAVLTSWTVNAGRYGHFLHSPRAMPTRLNRLFDLPMQEWWLDETNFGSSVAPSFGAAYLKAVAGDRPCAAEPYLMSRGNPYGTDSFPQHERLARTLLALTYGNVAAHSLGWPGHRESTREVFREVARLGRWLKDVRPLPWAALLVSEQTRQFYAYGNIAERFLPHVFGTFRAALEEHLPLTLVNDWELTDDFLARFPVLILANAAALSDAQAEAVRRYVRVGGGLVATAETSLFDELGRPRRDFALADLFGVSYRGKPKGPAKRPELDANFAITVDADYWKARAGVARITWGDHALVRDAKLARLVPTKAVTFRGPLAWVSEPKDGEVAWKMVPEGWQGPPLPGAVCRTFGKGRVAYLATAIDAALWSYAYPYQRRLLARAIEWATSAPAPVGVEAPMCVQATYFTQGRGEGRKLLVHLFNGVNTAAGHGLPAMEVPLREEVLPVHGIRVRFPKDPPKRVRLEPVGKELELRPNGAGSAVEVPPLELHALLVGEF